MLNNCSFTGRFVKDPESKSTQSGVTYVNFTLAVERNYAPEGGERITDFIDFKAWRGTAEFICKWFKKGSWVAVDGELQTSSYETEDGSKRKSVYVLARNVSFVGSAKDDQKTEEPTVSVQDLKEVNDIIPF